jgi:hypothetical protein
MVAFALRAIHKMRVAMERSAPLGYEDAAGFHFGVPCHEE